jgi:hypothetical protein
MKNALPAPRGYTREEISGWIQRYRASGHLPGQIITIPHSWLIFGASAFRRLGSSACTSFGVANGNLWPDFETFNDQLPPSLPYRKATPPVPLAGQAALRLAMPAAL